MKDCAGSNLQNVTSLKCRILSCFSDLQERTGVPNNGWLVRSVLVRPPATAKDD